MRQFIRHPADIPLEYQVREQSSAHQETLNNVSVGGLCFGADEPLPVGAILELRISLTRPEFQALARVVWCQRQADGYEIGTEFLQAQDGFRLRMVEQICHIHHYRKQVLAREGRNLSSQEAAREWISKFASDFPD
jgi:hypothetical protein